MNIDSGTTLRHHSRLRESAGLARVAFQVWEVTAIMAVIKEKSSA